MPKVSTVIPTYNMATYLRECLASILDQSFTDREVIVIDDGSTDDTPAVMEQFRGKVLYRRQENRGVAEALNAGIQLAKGEYVSLVAADDALYPNAMQTQVALLDRFPTAAMVHGAARFVDAAGRTIREAGVSKAGNAFRQKPRAAVRSLLRGNAVVCSSVMIRRSCLQQVGGFRPEFVPGEDWAMWLCLAARNDIICIRSPLVRCRRHNDSLTAKFTVSSLAASHGRILDFLFTQDGLTGFHDLQPYAYAANYRTLARLATRLSQRSLFLKNFARAVRRQPRLLLEKETYETIYFGARLFVPDPFVAPGREIKSLMRRPLPGDAVRRTSSGRG